MAGINCSLFEGKYSATYIPDDLEFDFEDIGEFFEDPIDNVKFPALSHKDDLPTLQFMVNDA